MKKDLDKKNEIAISVKNVSKTFKIPHEKITSLRGAVVSAFKSGGYEEFKALDDVSFELKKGEFFGIIGKTKMQICLAFNVSICDNSDMLLILNAISRFFKMLTGALKSDTIKISKLPAPVFG